MDAIEYQEGDTVNTPWRLARESKVLTRVSTKIPLEGMWRKFIFRGTALNYLSQNEVYLFESMLPEGGSKDLIWAMSFDDLLRRDWVFGWGTIEELNKITPPKMGPASEPVR